MTFETAPTMLPHNKRPSNDEREVQYIGSSCTKKARLALDGIDTQYEALAAQLMTITGQRDTARCYLADIIRKDICGTPTPSASQNRHSVSLYIANLKKTIAAMADERAKELEAKKLEAKKAATKAVLEANATVFKTEPIDGTDKEAIKNNETLNVQMEMERLKKELATEKERSKTLEQQRDTTEQQRNQYFLRCNQEMQKANAAVLEKEKLQAALWRAEHIIRKNGLESSEAMQEKTT